MGHHLNERVLRCVVCVLCHAAVVVVVVASQSRPEMSIMRTDAQTVEPFFNGLIA